MEQVIESIGTEGLEGNVRKQGLPSCDQLCIDSCLKFIPVRDYSNAEGVLAKSCVITLLVNLWSGSRSPERVEIAKIASQGKSVRSGAILCLKVKSPRILLRSK